MIENRISDRAKILLIDEDTSISYLIRRAMEKKITRFILQEVENREWR